MTSPQSGSSPRRDRPTTSASSGSSREYDSVGTLLEQAVVRFGSSVALRRRRQPMQWSVVTWTELGAQVRRLGAGLIQFGVRPGDRVALLSRTRLEWTLVDYAILSIGAVSVPLYHAATPTGLASILEDSGATTLVVEDRTQLDRLDPVLGSLPVERVVVIDVMDLRDRPEACLLDELSREGSRLLRDEPHRMQEIVARVDADSMATLVYTSGTTGSAKGVRLSHGAVLAASEALDSVMDVGSEDTTVLCLPLSHIYARLAQFAALRKGFCLAYARRVDRLDEVLREVRPTFFFAVPRIFERLYQGVIARYRELPPLLQAAFRRGVAASRTLAAEQQHALGGDPPDEPDHRGGLSRRMITKMEGRLADRAIFEPVREALGGRIRFCVSGGAPLNPDIARFFRLAGIEIREGYGLTETCAAGTINPPQDNRIGTVGRPLPGVRIRIAPDGEVLIRGPVVFDGYHNRAAETAEVLSEDGWLHTGDVGRFDDAGYLVIEDRKKDLIILSGAKNIAPQHVEATLRASPYIADAMVFGDRRPHLVALLTLDVPETTRFAESLGLDTTVWARVVRDPRVEELLDGEVARCNTRLARFEQVRGHKLIPQSLSVESGTLTPTFKVRREAVEARYGPLIERLYDAP